MYIHPQIDHLTKKPGWKFTTLVRTLDQKYLARVVFEISYCIIVFVEVYVAERVHRLEHVTVWAQDSFRWRRRVNTVGCTILC